MIHLAQRCVQIVCVGDWIGGNPAPKMRHGGQWLLAVGNNRTAHAILVPLCMEKVEQAVASNHAHGRPRRVVRLQRTRNTWCAGGALARLNSGDGLQMGRRNVAWAQDDRHAARAVDNGRFDADRAWAAVENKRHAVAKFLADMLGCGRADMAKTIGRRRGDTAWPAAGGEAA